MRALLIDPFQKRVHEIDIEEHIQGWHKWCDCEVFDHAYVGTHQGQRQDVWVDDLGMDRYPLYPCFKWKERHDPLIGYGLLTATTLDGDTVSTTLSVEYVLQHLVWEQWENRVAPDQFYDQLTRIYFYKGEAR